MNIDLYEKASSGEFVDNEIILKGIPSSAGLAYGVATVYQPENIISPSEHIAANEIEGEIELFNKTLQELVQEFVQLIEKVKDEPGNIVALVETNFLLVSDPVVRESIIKRIKNGYSAEASIIQEFDEQKQFFSMAKDRILRERAMEIDHIKERFLSTLRHKFINYSLAKDSIVVARSVTPSDLLQFKDYGLLGIITEVGGLASHTSILARSFEIPSVIGINNAAKFIENRSRLIVDGYTGTVYYKPGKESIKEYKAKKSREDAYKKKLGELVKLPSVTVDNRNISLMTNIDTLEEVGISLLSGAEGIGLVRTEHLILKKGSFPDEEEQYNWYKEIADRCYPHNVTFRAFDVGSDKHAEGLPLHEDNPALGFRGIRFLLTRKDIFESQIKAVLRVSVNKNIRFMLPLVTSVEEVIEAKEVMNKCRKELDLGDIPYDQQLPFGVMIETPAAALITDKLGEYVDFFSLGTNDLTQYTLAADRGNELVSNIYNTFHPSVLKLINIATGLATKMKKPIGVCGELAGHAGATSLLIGMGITELSVSPPIILELKSRIRETSYSDSIKLAGEVLSYTSQAEVMEKLQL